METFLSRPVLGGRTDNSRVKDSILSLKKIEQKKFRRVLIANRGEIAVRLIRTLHELDIEVVALYSDKDENSLHVQLADYAYHLPGSQAKDTYLNIPLIIKAIQESEVDAVHPGYGFLSENIEFAEAINNNTTATFIGPNLKALKMMGNKIEARQFLSKYKIPIVKGSQTPLKSVEDLKEHAKTIGLPLMLKAALGGGGKGMRIIRSQKDLETSYDACQREALSYFGSSDLFCEKYIPNPRHIEVQVLFDKHKNGIHLYERDCSIQRRHQKLFEEAPSSYLNDQQRHDLGEKALEIAKLIDYEGLGTVEFICESPKKIYFMEMNTRIQVEHPITEMITGVDLVKEQIKSSQGDPLELKQEDIKIKGWAMEARVNAEDPSNDFIPTANQVTHLHLPHQPFLRIDTHLYQGYHIPDTYDSLIAKMISWGNTREECRIRLLNGLKELDVGGLGTTCGFHQSLLINKEFIDGNLSTNFISDQKEYFEKELHQTLDKDKEMIAMAACFLMQQRSPLMSSSNEREEIKFNLEEW